MTMDTSKASLESLPSEIRAIIFRQIFQHSRILIDKRREEPYNWEPNLPGRSAMTVFHTCRRFYEEARSVLAMHMAVVFRFIRPAQLSRSIRDYYYPRIRKVGIFLKTNVCALDFTPFVALELLNIYDIGETYLFPSTDNEEIQHKCLEGGLDIKLKKAEQSYIMTSGERAWVRDLLVAPKRSYKLLRSVRVDWPEQGAPTQPRQSTLDLQFDLDTLRTIGRTVTCGSFKIRPHKVWGKNRIETWTAQPWRHSRQLEGIKEWNRDEEATLAGDPEMTNLEPERR